MAPILNRIKGDREFQKLYDEWCASVPANERKNITRDGIMHPTTYWREPRRLLFVTREQNLKKDKNADLAEVLLKGKGRFVKNLARWTHVLLDGVTSMADLTIEDNQKALRRVAVINLKKWGGGASADVVDICVHAFHDRERLREQVGLIDPHVILACGSEVFRLIKVLLTDASPIEPSEDTVSNSSGVFIARAGHPSMRGGTQAEFDRLVGVRAALSQGQSGRSRRR